MKGNPRKFSCSLDPYMGHPRSVKFFSTSYSTSRELLAGESNLMTEQFWQISVMIRSKISLNRPWARNPDMLMYGVRFHHVTLNSPEHPGGGKQPRAITIWWDWYSKLIGLSTCWINLQPIKFVIKTIASFLEKNGKHKFKYISPLSD